MRGIWKYFPRDLFNSVFFQTRTTPLHFTWWKTNPYYQGITIALMEGSCQMPPLSLQLHNENGKKKINTKNSSSFLGKWSVPVIAKRKQPRKYSVWPRDCPVLVPLCSLVCSSWGNPQARLCLQLHARRAWVILTTSRTCAVDWLGWGLHGCPFQFMWQVSEQCGKSALRFLAAGSRASVGLM